MGGSLSLKKLATRTRDLSSVGLPVTFAPPTKRKDEYPMKILSLDLGKFNSVCCLFDTKTRKHLFLTTPTQREYLAAIFADNQADLVVMEACGPSGWINDLAQSMGLSTLVCSANEEAWRKAVCCSPKPTGKLQSPRKPSNEQRWLNRAWITEGTQSATSRSIRVQMRLHLE
jgi:hypothetical protein